MAAAEDSEGVKKARTCRPQDRLGRGLPGAGSRFATPYGISFADAY